MASFSYGIRVSYDPSTGNYGVPVRQGLSNGDGIITDGEADTVFDLSPVDIISGGNGFDSQYLGTITINGLEYIAVENGPNGETISLYGPDSEIAFPGENGNLNPAPQVVLETYDTVCFAAGTEITTPSGVQTVEMLQIGDLIVTADGRQVPVRWIGRQTVHKLFAGDRARPVRVSAGALGDGLPHTDLVLTADHALILDDLAINAGALVNGATITLEPLSALADRVTYYHIETEGHDAILANGTPAETFVDYVGRQGFDNHAEYIALYGDERIITEMPLPRISTARLVPPALRARLAGRAVA